jgi:HlyD family secretion protein
MNKKKIVIIGALALFVIFILGSLFGKKETEFDLVEVVTGNISQEIFETGQVSRGDKINLSFKNTGTLESVYVSIGDEITPGQKLAKLDTIDLEIQLQEAMASLELAQLNLDKLLAGSTPEEIKISQSQRDVLQVAYETAERNLANSYDEALTVLDKAYPYIYNALDFVNDFIGSYVNVYDDDGREIMIARGEIETAKETAFSYLSAVKSDSSEQKIETALAGMKNSLAASFDSLEKISGIINGSSVYQNKVSSTDKTELDSHKVNINTSLTNVISSQQAISTMKSSLQSALASLQEAENRLSLVTAESQQVDINLYQAQIKQALARVQLSQNQLGQSTLVSPIAGKVAEINKRVGELVQPLSQDTMMVILPEIPYEIKVNIYEEDVVKVGIGNPVDITLVAFPGQTFAGQVISVNPAEKLVDGVVYYETTIGFNEVPLEIRPGMSADIVIKTASRENVLVLPEEAVRNEGNRNFVEVLVDKKAEERDVQVGLRGNDDMQVIK